MKAEEAHIMSKEVRDQLDAEQARLDAEMLPDLLERAFHMIEATTQNGRFNCRFPSELTNAEYFVLRAGLLELGYKQGNTCNGDTIIKWDEIKKQEPEKQEPEKPWWKRIFS